MNEGLNSKFIFKIKMKHWLNVNNITTKDFCNKYHVSVPSMITWLSGKHKPGLENIQKLVEATDGFINMADFKWSDNVITSDTMNYVK